MAAAIYVFKFLICKRPTRRNHYMLNDFDRCTFQIKIWFQNRRMKQKKRQRDEDVRHSSGRHDGVSPTNNEETDRPRQMEACHRYSAWSSDDLRQAVGLTADRRVFKNDDESEAGGDGVVFGVGRSLTRRLTIESHQIIPTVTSHYRNVVRF